MKAISIFRCGRQRLVNPKIYYINPGLTNKQDLTPTTTCVWYIYLYINKFDMLNRILQLKEKQKKKQSVANS